MDPNSASKFAAELIAELRKGPISPERAKEYSSRPWIDYLREHSTIDDLNAISAWIKTTENEDLIELCIGVARNLTPEDFIPFVKSVLSGTPGLSLRISAVLYLASKGLMSEEDWTTQAIDMRKEPDELLSVAKYFYGAKDNFELKAQINKRQVSGDYAYNEPYYKLLLNLI